MVIRLREYVVPAVAIVGIYIVVRQVAGFNLIDWAKGIISGGGIIPGGSKKVTLSPSTVNQGGTFTVSVQGLIAATLTKYGWKTSSTGVVIYETQFNADLDGKFSFQEQVLTTTSPGQYKVYFDQRPWGGPYYEALLTVIA